MPEAQRTVSDDQSACVPFKEPLEVAREQLGLVDGDERPAVIDPDEISVLGGIHQALSVLGRLQLVLASPHDEYIACKGALLFRPTEQLWT